MPEKFELAHFLTRTSKKQKLNVFYLYIFNAKSAQLRTTGQCEGIKYKGISWKITDSNLVGTNAIYNNIGYIMVRVI